MKQISQLLIFCFAVGSVTAQTNKANNPDNSKAFILGRIEELQSTVLGEKRTLNIYLPDAYEKDDTTDYPVIYLLDGSADEDFIHIVGLVQFNSFEWVSLLPKSIVVGIATVDRRRDFTFPTSIPEDQKKFPSSGQSEKFISFIAKELQPFIDKKYRTNKRKTIIGQSLGGLLATEVLLKKPSLFNTYIIVSPSLWWDNGSLLNIATKNLTENTEESISVYIGVGKEGLAPTALPRVMEVDANLLAEKLRLGKSRNLKIYFDYLPAENHATILHQAVLNSFKLLY